MVNQKTNMEILNEIRNQRNEQLKQIGRNDVFVTKVECLGTGENTGMRFFRLIEEKEVYEPGKQEQEIDPKTNSVKKEVWEWFYEYGDDGLKMIAVRNPNTQDFVPEGIMPLALDGKGQKEWDIEKGDIVKCLEEREKDLKAIAKELGISEEEIETLSEIDLSQKIEQKEEEKKKEKENESKQLSKEEVEKVGMHGMNEVNLNAKIDAKGTELGNTLKLEGYTKLLVVHSYKLAELKDSEGKQGKNTINKFNLIAQRPDGTYETIPENKLTPYRGANKEVTKINNKDNVETKNEDCIFEVPGTNKRLVIDQKDPYGIPDIYLAQNTRDNDGQMAQKLQDKYDGTERTDIEVRELFNKNKGEYQADKSVEEVKEHTEAGCEEIDIDEADGRKDTGHIHYNPEDQEQKNAIEEIMERGNVSREEAESKFMKELESSGEHISVEDAKENAIEEIEQEYRGIDNRRI